MKRALWGSTVCSFQDDSSMGDWVGTTIASLPDDTLMDGEQDILRECLKVSFPSVKQLEMNMHNPTLRQLFMEALTKQGLSNLRASIILEAISPTAAPATATAGPAAAPAATAAPGGPPGSGGGGRGEHYLGQGSSYSTFSSLPGSQIPHPYGGGIAGASDFGGHTLDSSTSQPHAGSAHFSFRSGKAEGNEGRRSNIQRVGESGQGRDSSLTSLNWAGRQPSKRARGRRSNLDSSRLSGHSLSVVISYYGEMPCCGPGPAFEAHKKSGKSVIPPAPALQDAVSSDVAATVGLPMTVFKVKPNGCITGDDLLGCIPAHRISDWPEIFFQDGRSLKDIALYTIITATKMAIDPLKSTANLQFNGEDTRAKTAYITYDNVAAWPHLRGTPKDVRWALLTSSPQEGLYYGDKVGQDVAVDEVTGMSTSTKRSRSRSVSVEAVTPTPKKGRGSLSSSSPI